MGTDDELEQLLEDQSSTSGVQEPDVERVVPSVVPSVTSTQTVLSSASQQAGPGGLTDAQKAQYGTTS